MSALCDALVALELTLGVLCQAPDGGGQPPLPENDAGVWEARPTMPEPIPEAPPFPPVIINQVPPPPPPPPPRRAAPAKPIPKPDPYRVALEQALTGRGIETPGLTAEGIAGFTEPVQPPDFGPLAPIPALSQPRYDAQSQTSGLPVDNSRILTADRYISGILETGLNSQIDGASGGQVVIQTSRDVFGYHGRAILIPKGSRLICNYTSPGKQGETRIAFNCSRILMAGHRAEILQLAAPVGDVQGRAGVTGEVDNRFWEKYGTAFMLAGVSATVRLATALSPSNGTNTMGSIADSGSQELSTKLGEITAAILEQTVNLAPIVTIAQGTRVQIRPAQDWYIREIGVTP